MEKLELVSKYIDENILHSKAWDQATDKMKLKAVNNAQRTLKLLLKNKYKDQEIPIDHLAEQCVWILKIDDSLQRAEMGVTYIQVDGVSMNISEKDRSIAPYIHRALNLPNGYFNRRRVGGYETRLSDSFRGGCRCYDDETVYRGVI